MFSKYPTFEKNSGVGRGGEVRNSTEPHPIRIPHYIHVQFPVLNGVCKIFLYHFIIDTHATLIQQTHKGPMYIHGNNKRKNLDFMWIPTLVVFISLAFISFQPGGITTILRVSDFA